MARPSHGPSAERRPLVATVAERMREKVFENGTEGRIGSLPELAAEFDVGIVTIQQAARILEHEGLLDVRRGPGGGYYGRRPDDTTLERALAAYMRLHPDSLDEALDIASLLFIELCGAAARCSKQALRDELEDLVTRLPACSGPEAVSVLELALQNLLFRMVDRPIFELLTRVTLRFAAMGTNARRYKAEDGLRRWMTGRLRIIRAIQAGDEPLARFEADRSNRREVVGDPALHLLNGGNLPVP